MTVLAFAPPGARLRVPPPSDLHPPELIAFRPGQTTAAVPGGVVRGDRDLYAVVARAGQRLSVAIEEPEGNAALALYEPGVHVVQGPSGIEFHGHSMTELDGADTDCWAGELPTTGPYLIAVGATRGNATYRMILHLD